MDTCITLVLLALLTDTLFLVDTPIALYTRKTPGTIEVITPKPQQQPHQQHQHNSTTPAITTTTVPANTTADTKHKWVITLSNIPSPQQRNLF